MVVVTGLVSESCSQLASLHLQGQAAAGQALQEAMAATREAASRVDATVSILRQVQVCMVMQLLSLSLLRLSRIP